MVQHSTRASAWPLIPPSTGNPPLVATLAPSPEGKPPRVTQGGEKPTASRARAAAGRSDALQARPMQAARPEPIDCASLVKPVDWPPIRSPQAVHSTVAELLRSTDAVEIGTRNGDGMRCFARTARSAVAIELESRYCTELRLHSRNMTAAGVGGFRVHCQDYRRGTPDADFYTLWEHVESAAYRQCHSSRPQPLGAGHLGSWLRSVLGMSH